MAKRRSDKITPGKISKIQRQLAEVTTEMKRLARLYKTHGENKSYDAQDMIKEELRELTPQKKQLEAALDYAVENIYAKDELKGDLNSL